MDVSVIIVNYKTPQLVIECVESIIEKTKDISYEIIIVDNDSQDNSKEIICNSLGNKIQYIQSNINLGFGKANNLGAKFATGKYLFLLNSDTLLVNNSIKELYDYIDNYDDCGIVGGNLYTIDMKPNPSYSMSFNTLEQVKEESSWKYIILSRINRKTNKNKESNDNFNETSLPKEVAYLFGADMMISKTLFNRINGFDDDFFMYYEEQELSYRVKKLGFKSVCIPNSKIIHYDGMSTKKVDEFSERQYKMRLNGSFVYYFKRYGISGLKQIYSYKIKSFERQLFISKLFNKMNTVKILNIQKECLVKEYEKILQKLNIYS